MSVNGIIAEPSLQTKNLFCYLTDVDVSPFELFSQKYAKILYDYCPALSKVTIQVYALSKKAMDEDNIPSPYLYSVSENMCVKLGFNKDMIYDMALTIAEQMAAIAHEIGHIIYQFLENKTYYSEESFADEVVCKLGLTTEIYSVLCKLENSGFYSDSCARFEMRKVYVSKYCKNNSNIDGVLIR